MAIISILNQKGGVGKTTLSIHLTHALQLQGANAVLVDSDPQGSTRDWLAINENPIVPVVSVDRPTTEIDLIERDIKSIAQQKDFIIVDGAPRHYEIMVAVLKASDCVIIPIQPSPVDVWATLDLIELVKQRVEATNGKLKAAFVITLAMKGTTLGADILKAVSRFDFPVFKTPITRRVIYPKVANNGTTVLDQDPKGEAAKEIKSFTNEVLDLLGEKSQNNAIQV